MRKEMNPKVLGAFVLSGIALFVTMLMIFGMGQILRKEIPFVMFFDGSLNGLQVGAPVKFRGITVGSVTDIKVILSRRTKDIYMPVYIEITPDTIQEIEHDNTPRTDDLVLDMIKRGLRGRLAMQNIVTGLLYIELDFEKNAQLTLVNKEPRFTEIPTVPSKAEELSDILSASKDTLEAVRDFVKSPKLTGAIDDFSLMMQKGRDTMTDIQSAAADAKDMLDTADKAIKDASIVVKDLKNHVDPIGVKVTQVLQLMEDSLNAIRILADYLSRHPESLVLGKSKS